MTARELGRDAVMVNCNPETVSTDYDTSDRLYFEPLTAEDVLAVCAAGEPGGRDRPVRRPDAAEAGPHPGRSGRAAARHAGRRDRPGRGPRRSSAPYPEFATATYIEPLLPGPVTKIIEKERPDALLPTLGGQTALNLAMTLHEDGTLERFGVELIGADAAAIRRAEDREEFRRR